METKLIELAYEVSDEIKDRFEYKRLLEIKAMTEEDPTLIYLITEFTKAKVKYEEVQKYGKYHPDLKRVQLLLQKTKEALYTNELVVEYKKLEKVIQKVLNDVSMRIATAVSENIKHPNELGLIPKH